MAWHLFVSHLSSWILYLIPSIQPPPFGICTMLCICFYILPSLNRLTGFSSFLRVSDFTSFLFSSQDDASGRHSFIQQHVVANKVKNMSRTEFFSYLFFLFMWFDCSAGFQMRVKLCFLHFHIHPHLSIHLTEFSAT